MLALLHKKAPAAPQVVQIPISEIAPNRSQPRRRFSADELTKLAKSISQLGVLQPLTIRRVGEGFELICGERRLRAAKLAGLEAVPCIISDVSDKYSALEALVENIQREDLDFFEQARGLKLLIDNFGMTQQQAAVSLGISQPAVANKLRLLRLSDKHRAMILNYSLTERHARALLRLDEQRRDEALSLICERRLTAESTEKYIEALLKQDKVRESYARRAGALGDVRLFFNTVEKALNIMRMAGVDASSEKKQNEGYIEYVIRIPDKDGKKRED